MSEKRSRATRVAVEGLERRETPSTHASAALPAAKVVDLRGTGAALVTASTPVVNGQDVSTRLAGKTRALGSFSGQLDVTYDLNLSRGVGTGVITLADGDQIYLNLNAVSRSPVSPRGLPGTIHFTVKDGTGAFAGATGHGNLNGRVNILYPYKFRLDGRVRE